MSYDNHILHTGCLCKHRSWNVVSKFKINDTLLHSIKVKNYFISETGYLQALWL